MVVTILGVVMLVIRHRVSFTGASFPRLCVGQRRGDNCEESATGEDAGGYNDMDKHNLCSLTEGRRRWNGSRR
jgi:hypothetical protein